MVPMEYHIIVEYLCILIVVIVIIFIYQIKKNKKPMFISQK